ncbi:hypothetical protein HU200_030718 [Digitaria exilis]|nr:hypothetical protein HU200_064612 [Digitaria exilis]KAF8706447.1 hypothetical protein HU200_030718 [Digitaria exilis]
MRYWEHRKQLQQE